MRHLVQILVVVVVSGCVVRAPSAAHLRPDEVASVSFSRTDPSIEVVSATIDADSVSASLQTVELAPGSHTISLRYRLRVSDICDDLRAECPTTTVTGGCSGQFVVSAGERAVLELSARRGDVEARARRPLSFGSWFEDSSQEIGKIACERHASTEGVRRGVF